jgi:hypothetical protein
MDDRFGIGELLGGAGEVLDRLRLREKELEEQLGLVRERITAGEAVLAAVERWRALPRFAVGAGAAGPVGQPPAAPAPVSAGEREEEVSLVEKIVLLLAQDPSRLWKPAQVQRALDVPAGSVHSALARLAERGRVVRVAQGSCRAAPPVG